MKVLKYISLVFGVIVLFSACAAKKDIMNPNFSYYGEKVSPVGYISFNDMMTVLEKEGTYTGKVKGTVVSVCQKKGCWMTLNSGAGDSELFIKFKDYGFFMPFELGGEQVVIRGTAKKETTSVQMLRHYAEDGGASKEEIALITEPETAFTFLADGVVALTKMK